VSVDGAGRPVAVAATMAAIGFVLLGLGWAGANPPAASPDEHAHLIKAYATATGQIDGQPFDVDVPGEADRTAAWFRDSGRSYDVPARLVPPPSVRCYAFDDDLTAACQDLRPVSGDPEATTLTPTHIGTYLPAMYLPAGLAVREAPDFRAATWRGRVATLIVCALFVGWAALLTARAGGALRVLGLVLAVTPMVVFLSASITTNGIEATAAICLWVAALRVLQPSSTESSAPWAALAVSGAVLALSRPLSAGLTVLVLVIAVALAGRGAAREALGRDRRAGTAALGIVAAGVAASAAWSAFVLPHPPLDLGVARRALPDAVGDLPNQARQLIGIFGWNDTTMPAVGYALGFAALAAVGVAALRWGDRRARLVLAGAVAAVVTLDVGIAVLIEAQIGFGMQARYVLPLVVGLPILAGEVLERRRPVVPAYVGSLAPAALAAAALLQVVAFVANAHRYAVGAGSAWAPTWDSRWAPVGGLTPWLALVLVGAGSWGVAALAVRRAGHPVRRAAATSVSAQASMTTS
jgi:hypothetical protein